MSSAAASRRRPATRILVVGNVVEDRAPDGRWTPGGPALYSAIAASRLGASVTLITHLSPGYDRSVLAGLDVEALPADAPPRYENRYDARGARSQRFTEGGGRLDLAGLDARRFDATILAPAYHELQAIGLRPPGLVIAALQGALRTADAAGIVKPHPDPAGQAAPFRMADYAFLSLEDTPDADSFACKYSVRGPATVVTAGAAGARIYREGRQFQNVQPVPAREVDPTGAGDCFLAAFVVRLLEGGDVHEAGRFAAASAAIAVEGSGVPSIPWREAVDSRFREVAA